MHRPDSYRPPASTGNYFSVLGVRPLIGRPLLPRDGRPDAPPVAVLSEMIWERDFGRDPDIVGRTVVLNHQPTTVVGVMPSRLALFAAHELAAPNSGHR